jgi:phosphonoacetate hydrolase
MKQDRKILIVCVDGMGPEYLEMAPTPNLDRIAREGTLAIGKSVVPSVTNVNNVSIITGVLPAEHGITANYRLDPATGEEAYMESAESLLVPTLLQRAQSSGMKTALVTSKKKLLSLLNTGADYSVAAEDPHAEAIENIGPAEDIYSAEINHWALRGALHVLTTGKADLVYCSMTDWAMHKHAPECEASCAHMAGIDAILGEIMVAFPELELYVTADHGMSAKTRGVDLTRALSDAGITGRAVPVIKDRYVAHHQNLGGSIYVHLKDPSSLDDALALLKTIPGVDDVYPRKEAAAHFGLMAERIGDLFVLGDRDTVFGDFESVEVEVNVRSHGSAHESAVPILAWNSPSEIAYERNLDIVRTLTL